MKLQKFLLFFLLVSIFYSCKTEQKQAILKENSTSIKYAKGFDIQSFDTYKKLIIKSPYPDAKEQFEYIIIPKGKTISKALKDLIIIRTPIEQIVVTSTTHIPMLELLEAENNLVGFPNTQYICSSKTRQLIANGTIKELGKEENINTEVLLDLNPEMLVGFSLNSNNKMFENIEKAGIPVLLNGDWLEETPLGRAEWLKFFGVLFNKEKLADSIFNAIAKDYNEAVLLVKEAKTKPTILSGVQFKDVWNLPAGKSFVAKLFKDANTEYLWAESEGKGSLSLSFESVFEKGQKADLWISPGHYKSYTQLKEANQHYMQFDAFNNKQIYSFNNKMGENGGVLYYELAPIQPHIVLKDIIKIAHPEILPDYVPYFLEKLQE